MRLKFVDPLDADPRGETTKGERLDSRGQVRRLPIADGDRRGRHAHLSRRGLDWTSKYRDLAAASAELGAESAIIDGEIIVLNDKGLSDFATLRKVITRRQHDLYFVAFDLLHLNGHDLRDMALDERREILESMIPADIRIQFRYSKPLCRGCASNSVAGTAANKCLGSLAADFENPAGWVL
ncbi:ATP-dependent DNA ligase [Mesorhizobium caraganae]|uniref:ATP-dependent DNA ligase n=1 Tax=Mesorhizobium caraganae TaxID=483206 RepID=UPI001FE2BC5F|nr:hypothetical protein [Mesorhizobium caraganae]